VVDWIGTCIDITRRKEIENELLETLEASQDRQSEVSALLEASKAVLIHREFGKASKVIFDCCKNLLGATAGYVALLSDDEKETKFYFLTPVGFHAQWTQLYRCQSVDYEQTLTEQERLLTITILVKANGQS
jgi:hypothetical protein